MVEYCDIADVMRTRSPEKILEFIDNAWHKAEFVHGDLSEHNIIMRYHDKLPIIRINDIADGIEHKYQYKIKILPLQKDQYEMLDMTHTGHKKNLYVKV